MSPVLIKQTVRAGQAYAVRDVDQPARGALALAVNGPDGWQVVAEQLDRRDAVRLMMRAAILAAGRPTQSLLGGAA